MQEITVVTVRNPFNLADREVHKRPYTPGAPVKYYLESAYLTSQSGTDLAVSRNGALLSEAELSACLVDPGDFLAVCPVVGKGDDEGKNIGLILANIALTVFAMYVAAPATFCFWPSVGYASVMQVGGALLTSFAQSQINTGSSRGVLAPSPGWGNLQPLQGQGHAVPILYGTVRTAGQIVAQHIAIEGDRQYLYLLLSGGEGMVDYPVGDLRDGIDKIFINGVPLEKFGAYVEVKSGDPDDGITWYCGEKLVIDKRYGTNTQTVISNFNDTYLDQYFQIEMVPGESGENWCTPQVTAGADGSGLEITVECPAGLYHLTEKGDPAEAWVKIRAQYKRVDKESWEEWPLPENGYLKAASYQPLHRVYRLDVLDSQGPGQYEVRCLCVAKSGDDPSCDATKVFWTGLSHIVEDDFTRPGKVLVGVKALATDELSGSLPTITWLQTRSKVLVCTDPATNHYEWKDADNPAWACYDLIHRATDLKRSDTGTYEIVVKGAPAAQIDYPAFAAWAAFCDEPIDVRLENGEIEKVKRCTVNLLLDSVDDLWRTLGKVEACGRGKVLLRGTKYSCIFDAPSEPTQLFTMGNIIKDSFNEEFLPMQDRAGAIEVTFLNATKNYQKDVLTVYERDADLSRLNPTQINLYGITEFAQAYREACYRLRLNKYLIRTISFEADVDAIACQVGDVILFQHDLPQWGLGGRLVAATAETLTLDQKVRLEPEKSYVVMVRLVDDTRVTARVNSPEEPVETAVLTLEKSLEMIPEIDDLYAFGEVENEVEKYAKPFRVVKISRSKDFRRRITAVEYDERIYEEANDEIPLINYAIEASPVTDLLVNEHMDYNGQVWMEITWKPPQEYFGARVVINGRQVAQVKAHQRDYSHPVTPQEKYQIEVTALDVYGNDLGATTLVYEVKAKTAPPDVQNITLFEDTYVQKDGSLYTNLTVNFEAPTRLPVYYKLSYRIKENDSWIDVDTFDENTYTISGVPFLGTVQVKVVTVDKRDPVLRSKGVVSPLRQLTGKGSPPPKVTGFNAIQDENDRSNLILTWNEPEIPDLKGYKIWLGDTWEEVREQPPVSGMVYTNSWNYQIPADLQEPPNRPYTFWIKAVDRTNLESEIPENAVINMVIVNPNAPAQGQAVQDPIDRTIAHLSWESVGDKDLQEYLVQEGEVWEQNAEILRTKETNLQYRMKVSRNYHWMIRARNTAGYLSSILHVDMPAVTVEPPDVTGFTGAQLASDLGIIRLRWDAPDNLGVSYFEIGEGPSWESQNILGTRITGTSFEAKITGERPYTFWIKAVNTGGIYSQHAVRFGGTFNLNPKAPTNLCFTQDPYDKSALFITWEESPSLDVVEYELRTGITWGTSKLIIKTKETSSRYVMPESGNIKVILKAINKAGYYSNETAQSNYFIIEPANVTGLMALQNGANVLLQWDKVNEPDVTGYEIREGSTFDNGALIVTGVTGTMYQIPVDTETTKRYHLKAVNRSGRYSQNAATVEITIVNLPPKNIIQEYDELLLQNGTHCHTEFGPSLINFSNLGGKFEDYDNLRFNEVGGHTVLKLKQYSLISDGHFDHPVDTRLWAVYTGGNLTKNTAGNLFLASAEPGNGITVKLPVLERNTTYVVEVKHKCSQPDRSSGFIGASGRFTDSQCVPAEIMMNNLADEWQVWSGEITTGTDGEEPDRLLLCYGVEPCTIELEWARLYRKADQANYPLGVWEEAYYPSGEYYTQQIALDEVINANIACQFISSITYRDGVNAKLQYRISRDNLIWSDWCTFVPVNATFKYLEFKVIMSTADKRKTPEVNSFKTIIDVPDIDRYGVYEVPAEGATIYYTHSFNALPCVIVTATEFGKRAEATNIATNKFQVKVVDREGNDTKGFINWLARGY